jgi:hypothetical protein
MVVAGGQGFASREERDRTRALPADPLQHGVVVAFADAKVTGNDRALAFFGQNTGKVSSAFFAREALLP